MQLQQQESRSRSRSKSPGAAGMYMTTAPQQQMRQSRARNLCAPLRVNMIGRTNLITLNVSICVVWIDKSFVHEEGNIWLYFMM